MKEGGVGITIVKVMFPGVKLTNSSFKGGKSETNNALRGQSLLRQFGFGTSKWCITTSHQS